MIGNDIEGQGGFAINGNSKLSENILIKDNRWIHTGGGYPYMFNCYSGYLQNITFENNYISGSGQRLGIAAKDVYIKNNTANTNFRIDNLYGEIIIENNTSDSISRQLLYINNDPNSTSNFFSNTEDTTLSYKNNIGGINAFNMLFLSNINTFNIEISNNTTDFYQINAFGCKQFLFNPKELPNNNLNFTTRGATFTSPSYTFSQTPIVGGGIYNVGDICTTNLYDVITLLSNSYYYNLFDNLSEYGNNVQNYFNSKGIKQAGLKCVKSGYLPTAGGNGFRYSDTKFSSGLKVQQYAYIFTDDSLYLVCNDGVLGDKEPTHKSGKVTNGDVELLYICELGKVELFIIS